MLQLVVQLGFNLPEKLPCRYLKILGNRLQEDDVDAIQTDLLPYESVPGAARPRVCDARGAGQIAIDVVDARSAGSYAGIVSISSQIGKLRLRPLEMLILIEKIFLKP
jgi:hypothetical protein